MSPCICPHPYRFDRSVLVFLAGATFRRDAPYGSRGFEIVTKYERGLPKNFFRTYWSSSGYVKYAIFQCLMLLRVAQIDPAQVFSIDLPRTDGDSRETNREGVDG